MSFRAKLVGTWRLEHCRLTGGAGDTHPLSEDPQGMLMYSSDGYMSSWVGRPGMPIYAKSWSEASTEEAVEIIKSLSSYNGKFYLNEKPGNKQEIYHEIRLSVPPNFNGTVQKRNVEIWEEGSKMKLRISVEEEVKHGSGVGRLVLEWEKEPVNNATEANSTIGRIGDR